MIYFLLSLYSQCEWNFNLPAKHEDEESASPRHRRRFYRMLGRALPEESMDVVFECDAFDIGVAQVSEILINLTKGQQ